MARTIRGAALACAALLVLTACGGGGNPYRQGGGGGNGTVVVGSANFSENVLLGHIYARAIEAKGVQVTEKFNIGSREVLFKQIKSGSITVLPEYNGALLAYLDPGTKATTTQEINKQLRAKLPAKLATLESAKAQNKDSLTVTAETAKQYDLKSISDLESVDQKFVLGGPPEFKTRYQGMKGLQKLYGLEFERFKSLDTGGPITVSALKKGDIQVANLFTTDPAIDRNDFVVLEDPKHLFSSQNITPLVYKPGVNDKVRQALNAVSAKLDTRTMSKLLKRYVVDKDDPDKIAKDWLTSQGLI